jgi:hypothetical protein
MVSLRRLKFGGTPLHWPKPSNKCDISLKKKPCACDSMKLVIQGPSACAYTTKTASTDFVTDDPGLDGACTLDPGFLRVSKGIGGSRQGSGVWASPGGSGSCLWRWRKPVDETPASALFASRFLSAPSTAAPMASYTDSDGDGTSSEYEDDASLCDFLESEVLRDEEPGDVDTGAAPHSDAPPANSNGDDASAVAQVLIAFFSLCSYGII